MQPRILFQFSEKQLSDTVKEFSLRKNNPTSAILLPLAPALIAFAIYRSYLLLAATVVLYLTYFFFLIREESVIIMKDFGVQLKARYWLGREKNIFIDNDAIDSVLLHEVIVGSEVHFQVAYLLRNEKLVPAFNYCHPGLEILQKIYAACVPLGKVKFES